MEEENKGTETITVTIPAQDDLEAKNASLETEKVRLQQEAANYRAAYLKEAGKNKTGEEEEDERMTRIAQKALADSRLAQIAVEQDAIIQKALKENRELKLAQLNKTQIPVSTSTHTEGQPVKDTMITPEQMAQFKSMGKSDKWIENYKKNLARNTR